MERARDDGGDDDARRRRPWQSLRARAIGGARRHIRRRCGAGRWRSASARGSPRRRPTSAKTTLVFPASIASNMARALDRSAGNCERHARRHVAGADDLDAAAGEPQPQRAVGLDPVERAGDALARAAVDVERRCRAGARAPATPARRRRDRPRATPRAAARSLPRARARRPAGVIAPSSAAVLRPSIGGAAARLTPKPATTRSPERSSRMPASLASPSIRSLGHLRLKRAVGRGDLDRLDQRQPGGERQRRRGRIAVAQLDHGRAEEIAVERFPRAAVAPAPRVLAQRDQPVALDRQRVGEQVRCWSSRAARRCGCGSEQRSRGVVGHVAERADQQIAERRDEQRGEQDQHAFEAVAALGERAARARRSTSP